MKTITLDNGKKVKISNKSYANLEKAAKPEFKEGWYKYVGISACPEDYAHYPEGYGFTNGKWSDTLWTITKPECWQEADPKEIEKMLLKEAEKRGYKIGTIYRSVGDRYDSIYVINGKIKFYERLDKLTDCWIGAIYNQGKWAEIVKNAIMIGEYEAEIYSNGDKVKVGCQIIDFATVKKVYRAMKKMRKQ